MDHAAKLDQLLPPLDGLAIAWAVPSLVGSASALAADTARQPADDSPVPSADDGLPDGATPLAALKHRQYALLEQAIAAQARRAAVAEAPVRAGTGTRPPGRRRPGPAV